MNLTQFGGRSQKMTGAGVILFEEYNNQQGRKEWAVVLFRDKNLNAFADLGGSFDQEDRDSTTVAIREAMEESANYIHIQSNKNILNNSIVTTEQYQCYFVAIEGGNLFRQSYLNNINKINQNYAPPHWKETDQMTRFYLTDMFKQNLLTSRGNLNCPDSHGKMEIIMIRAVTCLQEGFKQKLITKVISEPRKVSHEFTNQTNDFKNGTTSVIIF